MKRLLERYRLLLLIYGLAVAAAVWEVSRQEPTVRDVTDTAVLPLDADALVELWPDHADACYVRNIRARFLRFDLDEARTELENGLALGPKSTERLSYEYAYVLVLMHAPEVEIEAAVARWQRNFPFSKLEDPRTLQEPPFPAPLLAASHWLGALSLDGGSYARISVSESLEIWDIASGSVAVIPPEQESAAMYLLGFSHDGKTLAAAGRGDTVPLLDVDTQTYKTVLRGHEAEVYSIAFSPSDTVCATGSVDCTVRLWDAVSGEQLRVFTDHARPVSALSFSADAELLAAGDWRGVITLRQLETDTTLTLTGHSGAIAALALSPDGTTLASASRDSTVKLWDTATGLENRTLRGHTAPVSTVAFSRDGQLVASGGADRTVRIRGVATGALRQSIMVAADVFSMTFTADDRTLAVACTDNSVRPFAINQTPPESGLRAPD